MSRQKLFISYSLANRRRCHCVSAIFKFAEDRNKEICNKLPALSLTVERCLQCFLLTSVEVVDSVLWVVDSKCLSIEDFLEWSRTTLHVEQNKTPWSSCNTPLS